MKYSLLSLVSLLWLVLACVACVDNRSGSNNLEVQVWDHREAIEDFSELWIIFSKLGIHPVGQPRTKAWLELEPSVQKLDLTQYASGARAAILTASVEPGAYNAIRLTVDQASGVLVNGEQAEISVHFEPIALDFLVRDGRSTILGLDLVVFDLSDHPDRGYELHIREAIVIQGE